MKLDDPIELGLSGAVGCLIIVLFLALKLAFIGGVIYMIYWFGTAVGWW